ncbi:AB hydrolase superfamily protein [Colletotrichum sp. SAR11_59]|nr:AB hydrolase superfamily protein [Colletotrichum sp. SAR11_59]
MLTEKTKPEYVDLDTEFHPLPKHGHLSAKHPVYTASEAAVGTMYEEARKQENFASLRSVFVDADAPMPRGGPDRYRDVITELLYFKARDGKEIELKVYKSPNVEPNAALMYRMHGGGHQRVLFHVGSMIAMMVSYGDNDITGIAAQVLHFPIICHPKFFPKENYEFGSYTQNEDSPVLGALAMEGYLDAYLPKPTPDHRHSPILAETLKGLPRTRESAREC